jgi:RNA polymerase sigma-70 factor (ECF subfamily)
MRRAEPDRDDEWFEAGAHAFDLREVVVEHRADIFRYARSFCRSDADAEDLAQTAVVRALASGSEVRNPERAKWYLLRIVRNLATDQARAKSRFPVEPWADLPETASAEPAPDARLLHDEEREVPRAAFADLPRVHQEVLRLRFVEELDHAAIAERLETTEQAARQRLYRAMQALRALTQQRQFGLDNP